MQSNALGGLPELKGFMRTGAAIVTRSKKFKGLVLELVHGKGVDDLIAQTDRLQITFIQHMLRQVGVFVLMQFKSAIGPLLCVHLSLAIWH